MPRRPKARQRVPEALPEAILLDPWLTTAALPAGQPLASLIDHIAASLPTPRADAAQRRLEVLATLLANFIASEPPHIAVPQGRLKATRYDRPAITGRQLKPTLDALESAGMITRVPYDWRKRRTIAQPAASLSALMASHGVTTASITRLPDEEVIVLKKRKARIERDGDEEEREPSTINVNESSLIDYPDDCHEANFERQRLRRLNAFLARSDIRIEGSDNPPPSVPFKRIYSSSGPVSFSLHGRLYAGQVGGWHQALPKDQRDRIRINGEGVVELDFSSMHLRLAYAEARCPPPEGDLYAIPGLDPKAHRPAIKIVVSAMLSHRRDLTKLPPEARKLLPNAWTGRRLASAIKERHAPIAHLFGKDKGIQFMWRDSEILMVALERLMERGIAALPLHDAILAQASAKDIAIEVMQGASMDLIGVALPVGIKSSSEDAD